MARSDFLTIFIEHVPRVPSVSPQVKQGRVNTKIRMYIYIYIYICMKVEYFGTIVEWDWAAECKALNLRFLIERGIWGPDVDKNKNK